MTAAKKTRKPAPKAAPKPEGKWLATPTHGVILHHADEIDERVADLHAAVLAMSGPFAVDAKKCGEILSEVVDALRWQSARMRCDAFGLIIEPEAQ